MNIKEWEDKIIFLYKTIPGESDRSYGIEAAANTYFNKSLENLSIDESATIAAIAQLPSRINPVKNPRRTLQRRNWILSRMLKLRMISKKINHREGIDITPSVAIRMNKPDQVPFTTFI